MTESRNPVPGDVIHFWKNSAPGVKNVRVGMIVKVSVHDPLCVDIREVQLYGDDYHKSMRHVNHSSFETNPQQRITTGCWDVRDVDKPKGAVKEGIEKKVVHLLGTGKTIEQAHQAVRNQGVKLVQVKEIARQKGFERLLKDKEPATAGV